MDLVSCNEFAEALGLEKISVEIENESAGTGWVRARCPYDWMHPHGVDRHPSFGIYADPEGPSYWNCFAHGGGDLSKLIHTLTWKNHFHYKEACSLLSYMEVHEEVEEREEWPSYTDVHMETEEAPVVPDAIPDEVLKLLPSVLKGNFAPIKLARKFLIKERGIHEETIKHFDIRYAPGLNSVVFPVRSDAGDLYCFRARKSNAKKCFEITPDLLDVPDEIFPGLRTGALFGAHLLNPTKPVMVVEAELEAMRVHTLGFDNVSATCGGVNKYQLNLMGYPMLLLGFDSDLAGNRSAAKVARRYAGKSIVYRLNWGEVGIKDPGELESPEQLEEVLQKKEVMLQVVEDVENLI